MNETTLAAFHKLRRKYPTMPAKHVLSWLRGEQRAATERELWEEGSDGRWKCEREGFTLHLRWHVESTGPMPDRHGFTEYGSYVQPAEDYYPHVRPSSPTPMGLPAELFRSANRDGDYYFFLDDVEDQYDYYRRSGMAKQPARELLCEYVRERVKGLVGGHTDWDDQGIENGYLSVTAYREGVELGQSGIGTDMIADGYEDAAKQVFSMLDDYGLVDEAIDNANATLALLCERKET